ncbi:MAG: aldehyde ferredoxin oxidoreductase N-terminal domain-containing protein [Anaerolineae bacterium]|jgi:aldehyde:ferredoxin oxidoreductase
MNGHMGKILRVNLTSRQISTINTADYEEWYGGHGIGSAIAFDLIDDWTIDGFDPGNVVTFMTSPLSGTIAPSASGRTEVQGIGVQAYPIAWFTRSNFGGRFSGMLKYAGWDGVVVEGAADSPVWVDIRNDEVQIRDASGLWGMTTWEAQEEIWRQVGADNVKDWRQIGSGRDSGRTTQRPAVVAIGPAGENLSRTACLLHDAGAGGGQGGFGAVLGSKNLKAISVLGTGSVQIGDPSALLDARIWAKNNYAMDLDNLTDGWTQLDFSDPVSAGYFGQGPLAPKVGRPSGCLGCISACRQRYETGQGNESICVEAVFYIGYDIMRHGQPTAANNIAADLLNQYGINAYEARTMLPWLIGLNAMGVLGPGMEIDTDLPFDQLGSAEFADVYLRAIAFREGKLGDDLAEGGARCAERWGRLDEDLASGLLDYAYWGLPNHGYDPRAELEWGYGSILGDRDINEHGFNPLFWRPTGDIAAGIEPYYSAELVATIYAEKMIPYEGDPLMVDYSTENMYSDHWAKTVAWQRHYTRFWKQSILYCDWRWPNFYNPYAPDDRGITVEGEPKFLNAVTGGNLSFAEGMELGRKIWNLDNAIWTLQGRHRDMVHFPEYIYTVPYPAGMSGPSYYLPGRENGNWTYIDVAGRVMDKAKFDEWKTKFYTLEGWDTSTGWPTRSTLEGLGLNKVADKLEANGKLGAS